MSLPTFTDRDLIAGVLETAGVQFEADDEATRNGEPCSVIATADGAVFVFDPTGRLSLGLPVPHRAA